MSARWVPQNRDRDVWRGGEAKKGSNGMGDVSPSIQNAFRMVEGRDVLVVSHRLTPRRWGRHHPDRFEPPERGRAAERCSRGWCQDLRHRCTCAVLDAGRVGDEREWPTISPCTRGRVTSSRPRSLSLQPPPFTDHSVLLGWTRGAHRVVLSFELGVLQSGVVVLRTRLRRPPSVSWGTPLESTRGWRVYTALLHSTALWTLPISVRPLSTRPFRPSSSRVA